MPCQACTQADIAVRTALLEREHDARVIKELQRKLAEAERRIKDLERTKTR